MSLCALLLGFVLGWICCETRVWRQIKKNARPAQPCPCCGAHAYKAGHDCPGCSFPNCGHEHNQEAAMAFLKKDKL